jgi:non-specific serine/threonine protein kinase
MRDLGRFRAAVRDHRRVAGRSQQQLARSVGLHPDMLSHKLNGSDNAVLTAPDVVSIVTTLAGWGALASRPEVDALLGLMDVPPHAITTEAWSVPPLVTLPPATLPPAPQRLKLSTAPLPAPATPLIGRERERAEVAAALAGARLVTLTGAGGTGKTRLATQVAWDLAGEFADGVAFVDLAPVRNPALFVTTIARTLGLAPTSAEAAEAHVVEALRDRELLLVTDNLEHLLEETQLLARMMTAVPALRLLATSRIPLRLYGEQTVRVPPLHLPGEEGTETAVRDCEAVRLFIARAQAVRSDFDPQAAELAAVGGICTTLDGLPLAIELAAARIRLHSPSALLPLLRSRLALLTGGPRDLPHRQQTLRAALDWSYALLSPDAQRLFARLGVLAGPFDAAAAAAVSGEQDPVTTLDQLADLADQSLLEVTTGDVPSFRMLQTVQEYSLARLAETGEEDTVRHRHLAHFLAVASDAGAGLTGPGQAKLLDQLELVYPNIRAALEFAYVEGGRDSVCLGEGLRLAAALSPLWQQRGSLAEGVLQLDRLLACDDMRQRVTAARVRASAVLAACTLACFQGDYARTAELAWHGIELCTPLDDHQGLARAYRFLGETALARGDHATAEPHFERQRAEASLVGEVSWLADAYNMLGQPARYRGQFGHAQQLLWQSVRFAQAANDPSLVGVVLCSLGEVARDAGRPVQARRLYRAALRRHAALGNKRHMAYEFEGLAAAAGLEHAGLPALTYLGAAQALRDETGGPLPPAEQVILDRILTPALVPLSAAERRAALSHGRNQPLATTIAQALGPRPGDPT